MRGYEKQDLMEAVRIFNASSRIYRFNRTSGFLEAKGTEDQAWHSKSFREVEAAFACFLMEYDMDMGSFSVQAAESKGYDDMMRRIRGGEPELVRTLMGALEASLEGRRDAGDGVYRDSYGVQAGDWSPVESETGGGADPAIAGGEAECLLQVADLLLAEDGRPQEAMPEEYEDQFPLAADYFRAHRFEAADLNDRRVDCTKLFNRTANGPVPNRKFWESEQITIRLTPVLFGQVRCAIGYH